VKVLAYMHAQSTFFHQGFDLFDDLEEYMKTVATQVGIHCIPYAVRCNALACSAILKVAHAVSSHYLLYSIVCCLFLYRQQMIGLFPSFSYN